MNGQRYLIAGIGKTGLSIARYLRRRSREFVVFDTRINPSGLQEFKAEFPDVEVWLGDEIPRLAEHFIEIISSPGVDHSHHLIQQAIKMNIPIIGDIECFAREVTAPVVAITGTNGKSTVTTLLGEMAREAGLVVAVAGNIGLPVLEALDDGTAYDLWVLELSSFQLELTTSLAPTAATILNISPDHLDRHGTIEAYIAAKQRIYNHAQFCVYNRDDLATAPQLISKPAAESISFGLTPPGPKCWGIMEVREQTYLSYGDQLLLSTNSLGIKGQHNWANALATCALALAAGITMLCMQTVLQRFSGLAHRSQLVKTINGVDWINDSKGTNIGATISALTGVGAAISGKVILIAGGQGKGADFSELRNSVQKYVRAIVLIGVDAVKIEAALTDVVRIVHAESLDDAVVCAKKEAITGDVVLLSPACASLDMFRDFNHRGEVFTQLVEAL